MDRLLPVFSDLLSLDLFRSPRGEVPDLDPELSRLDEMVLFLSAGFSWPSWSVKDIVRLLLTFGDSAACRFGFGDFCSEEEFVRIFCRASFGVF